MDLQEKIENSHDRLERMEPALENCETLVKELIMRQRITEGRIEAHDVKIERLDRDISAIASNVRSLGDSQGLYRLMVGIHKYGKPLTAVIVAASLLIGALLGLVSKQRAKDALKKSMPWSGSE